MKKKYLILGIFILLIFLPKTNSKYVLSSNKNLGINTPKFNIIETTNGPLTINDNKKDYLEIKFENKENKDVKGYIEIDGVKVKDITVPASSEETYKINIDDVLYQRLVECDIYPVKVKYTSPYKITRDVTTIKKASLTIHGRVKCMNLGSAKDNGIDYSKINSETNGEGVYLFDETKNDTNPVYFFRGTHNLNNNLLYAGFCWKIVRTTETGGVRVVYNGDPVNGKCLNIYKNTEIEKNVFNFNHNSKKYSGYMYGDEANPYENKYDSDIKKYIDNWYKNNIKDKGYDDSLDKRSIYCGDRTEIFDNEGNMNYAPVGRLEDSNPSMHCPKNDSYSVEQGNKKLRYPIALLTTDEVIMSGMNNGNDRHFDFYLCANQYYLLSPYGFSKPGYASVFYVDADGLILGAYTNGSVGVRPAITLKGELPVLEGDGSKDKPFVMTKTKDTLYNRIKSQSLGSAKDNGINYSTGVTVDFSDVYLFDETKDAVNPVYFFRGNHYQNNNLLYANICWKIVRTTETGGVRVVYNGTPVNGKCTNTKGLDTQLGYSTFNNVSNSKKYVGYMYGDDANPYQNIYDSDIKKYIDNWYKTNIKDKGFEEKLDKKAIYCGDRTEGSVRESEQYYAGYDRIHTGNPTMKCPVNDSYSVEAGNRKLTYPVALLSTNDIMLVGGLFFIGGEYHYLNTKEHYWLLSPGSSSNNSATVMGMVNKGFVFFANVNYTQGGNSLGVRPAITIAPSATIISGDGSQNNPYVI